MSSPRPDDTADEQMSRRLTGFYDDADRWFVVDDTVMGGRSSGSVTISRSVMTFEGTTVTDGGGFSSVRRALDAGELTGAGAIRVRLRSDGRSYEMMLDDEHRIDGRHVSYRADLDPSDPTDDAGWQIATVDLSALVPTIHGRIVDAPAFAPDQATEIAVIVADDVDGPFSLHVDWIDAL